MKNPYTLRLTVSKEEHEAIINRAKSEQRTLAGYLRWLVWQDLARPGPPEVVLTEYQCRGLRTHAKTVSAAYEWFARELGVSKSELEVEQLGE